MIMNGDRRGADRALGARLSRAVRELGGESAARAVAPRAQALGRGSRGRRPRRAGDRALVANYRATGLVDDAAYAVGRARGEARRGQSLLTIRAGLAAKGVGAGDAAAAIDTLREDGGDPDLAAASPSPAAAASVRSGATQGFAGRSRQGTRRLRPRRLCPGGRRSGVAVRRRGGSRNAARECQIIASRQKPGPLPRGLERMKSRSRFSPGGVFS